MDFPQGGKDDLGDIFVFEIKKDWENKIPNPIIFGSKEFNEMVVKPDAYGPIPGVSADGQDYGFKDDFGEERVLMNRVCWQGKQLNMDGTVAVNETGPWGNVHVGCADVHAGFIKYIDRKDC